MSQENVEIVRRVYAAASRGDLDALLKDAAPEIEVDWSRSRGPHKGVYRGPAAARSLFEHMVDAWSEFHWEPEELIDAGETVVAATHLVARGQGSGIEIHGHAAQAWTIRGGMIVSARFYQTRADALNAIGLGE